MSSDVKKLVEVLEKALAERGGSLDAPAQATFRKQIEALKKAVDKEEVAKISRWRITALNVTATIFQLLIDAKKLLE